MAGAAFSGRDAGVQYAVGGSIVLRQYAFVAGRVLCVRTGGGFGAEINRDNEGAVGAEIFSGDERSYSDRFGAVFNRASAYDVDQGVAVVGCHFNY